MRRFLVFLCSFTVTTVAATALAADPALVMSAATEWLTNPPGWLLGMSPILWDILRRLWPTNNAAGLLHDAAAVLQKAGATVTQAGGLILALALLSDKLAPQNLKPATPPVEPPKP